MLQSVTLLGATSGLATGLPVLGCAGMCPSVSDKSLGKVVDTSRHVDDQLYQIQTRLLRTAGTLVALLDGLEGEVASEPNAVVPAADVLGAVKAALHFLSTTNNFVSVQRRSAHIQRIDPSLVSLAAEGFPDPGEELFNPQLIERLTKSADAQRTVADQGGSKETTRRLSRSWRCEAAIHSSSGIPCATLVFSRSRSCLIRRQVPRVDLSSVPISPSVDASCGDGEASPNVHQRAAEPRSWGQAVDSVTLKDVLPASLVAALPVGRLEVRLSLPLQLSATDWERPLGGRLRYFVPAWREVTRDPWILQAVQGGGVGSDHGPCADPLPAEAAFVHRAYGGPVAGSGELVQKEAVVRLSESSSRSFMSELFVIPKADGRLRPVIDLRELSTFLPHRHFKMEGIPALRDLLQPANS